MRWKPEVHIKVKVTAQYRVFTGGKAAGAWRWPLPLAPMLKKELSYTSTTPLGLPGLF
jgi:hypothetical protein